MHFRLTESILEQMEMELCPEDWQRLALYWVLLLVGLERCPLQVATMSQARVKKKYIPKARDENIDKAYLAQDTGYIRRRLSQTIVVGFGQRLVSRMAQVGKNAQLARKRRQQWWRKRIQLSWRGLQLGQSRSRGQEVREEGDFGEEVKLKNLNNKIQI